jgi:hypothetical protein
LGHPIFYPDGFAEIEGRDPEFLHLGQDHYSKLL